jgi:hypothetical protein
MHDALRRLFQLTNSPWKWTAWLRPSSTSALSPCASAACLKHEKCPLSVGGRQRFSTAAQQLIRRL